VKATSVTERHMLHCCVTGYEGDRMYVKVFGTILKSSVWDTDPATRCVWLAMLVSADEQGFVRGTVQSLARDANVSLEQVEKALNVFLSPDLDSATPDEDGRRINKVDGGWFLINYAKYREIRTKQQVQTAERMRRMRRGKGASHVTHVTPYAEAEAEEKKNWLSPYIEDWKQRFGADPIAGQLAKALSTVHKEYGLAVTRERWRFYLSKVSGDYVSPARFAATFGEWNPETRPMSDDERAILVDKASRI